MKSSFGPVARTLTLKRPQPSGSRYLLVPAQNRGVTLDGSSIRIGTDPECELQVRDPAVSRFHCEVTRRKGRVLVRDLGSKNGVVLQSVRVTEGEMRVGDAMRLGETVVVLVDEQGEENGRRGEVLPGMVGVSEVMKRMAHTVRLLAPSDLNILVTGETGTGKELVARALHLLSPRREGAFVALNCGSIPQDLVESELFGHERGAFTGAVEARAGLFEQASGGTLLLDEVGELPVFQQPRLLRVLETGRVRRVGGQAERDVDVRVIAATHVDLPAAVQQGRFRQDLYYRINEAQVRVPPLSERMDDVLPLVERFMEEAPGARAEPGPEVWLALRARRYHGNVRELRSIVRRSLVLGWSEVDSPTFPESSGGQGWRSRRWVSAGSSPVSEAQADYSGTFDEIQRRVLERALAMAGGNKSLAARSLGMAKSTFSDKLRKLNGSSGRP